MAPELYRGSASYPSASAGPVVTIGNFDGVHRGHRTLLGRTVELARAAGAPALVYTFHPAPRDVLRPGNPIPRIQTLEDKVARLGAVGIDHVVVETFTREFGAREPRWFVEEVLAARLGVRHLVVGWDFRFGRGRQGTIDDLHRWLDAPVEQIGPYAPDGRVVSSSRIREAVKAGDVATAAALLGRPHEVRGTVVRGDGRGRGISFPTANVRPDTALVPGGGVYAVRVDLGDGSLRPAMANIGTRPTFGGGAQHLEVHVFDLDADLYGATVTVAFVDRLRDERAFDSVDALVAQLGRDATAARARLA